MAGHSPELSYTNEEDDKEAEASLRCFRPHLRTNKRTPTVPLLSQSPSPECASPAAAEIRGGYDVEHGIMHSEVNGDGSGSQSWMPSDGEASVELIGSDEDDNDFVWGEGRRACGAAADNTHADRNGHGHGDQREQERNAAERIAGSIASAASFRSPVRSGGSGDIDGQLDSSPLASYGIGIGVSQYDSTTKAASATVPGAGERCVGTKGESEITVVAPSSPIVPRRVRGASASAKQKRARPPVGPSIFHSV
jgi:hypothetical protein